MAERVIERTAEAEVEFRKQLRNLVEKRGDDVPVGLTGLTLLDVGLFLIASEAVEYRGDKNGLIATLHDMVDKQFWAWVEMFEKERR